MAFNICLYFLLDLHCKDFAASLASRRFGTKDTPLWTGQLCEVHMDMYKIRREWFLCQLPYHAELKLSGAHKTVFWSTTETLTCSSEHQETFFFPLIEEA